MEENQKLDVIIIGGSYAGLSAAMSLGRAIRNVLIIDNGKPCNQQTPHSHNFITQDGSPPGEIYELAKTQVSYYPTIKFYKGLATKASIVENGFTVETESGDTFKSRKLLFATGLRDLLPEIDGFKECWGISILHCPYCHGYEIKNEDTGILGNGEMAFELARLISNWTKTLSIFTNGKQEFTEIQLEKLKKNGIRVVETEIKNLQQNGGKIQNIVFKDGSETNVKAIYSRPKFLQHCSIPADLGCELTESGLLKVDGFQRTNVSGVYACGDNSNLVRAVALAVSSGSFAGASLNKDLIEADF